MQKNDKETGQVDIDTAVKLLKNRAYDYFVKWPQTREKLTNTIRNIHHSDQLRNENELLKKAVKEKYNFRKLIKGNSPEIEHSFELMGKAVATNMSVSVSGETGTGKELVAKGIHYNSKRKDKPFIAVNVSASVAISRPPVPVTVCSSWPAPICWGAWLN